MPQILLTVLLGFLASQYLPDTQVTPLSFDAGDFKHDFNMASDRPKLVAVFSPT